MTKISFYRQRRVDGGVRTEIEIDDETVLHRFERGRRHSDPVLLWYVDLRCQGRRLPTAPEAARDWLLDNAAVVRAGFANLAEEVRAGVDIDSDPLQRRVLGAPRGVQMTIVCFALHRLKARGMADILSEAVAHWQEWVQGLQPVGTPQAI